MSGRGFSGHHHSMESRLKISLGGIGKHSGTDHPLWKGDNALYSTKHTWARRNIPKPNLCLECGLVPPYEIANISGKYLRDVRDWIWLCHKCHTKRDLKDMSNRRCCVCGKSKTHVLKKNGRPKWLRGDNGFICNSCHSSEVRMMKRYK